MSADSVARRSLAALPLLALGVSLALSACVGGPPPLKEGLWSVHGENIVNPGGQKTLIDIEVCRDHAYDKTTDAALKNLAGCRTVSKNLGAGQFTAASTCSVNGTTIVSSGTMLYKNGESTHTETESRYQPPLDGKTSELLTQEQRYRGKCPPGMKPGDTIDADGILRHHG